METRNDTESLDRWAVYRMKEAGKGWVYVVRKVRRGIPSDRAQPITRASANRREQQRFAKALNAK